MMQKRNFWEYPWGFKESFAIATGILIIGLVLHSFTGGFPKLQNPVNIYAGVFLTIVNVGLFLISRRYKPLRWFAKHKAAIGALALFFTLSLFMAFVPNNYALSQVLGSWSYALAFAYLLITLGMATLTKAIPFKKKNIGFLLNHLGFWILLFTSHLGAGDIQKVRMSVRENETVWYGVDKNRQQVQMPLAIKLKDFSMKEYDPKIAIVQNQTGKLASKGNSKALFEMNPPYNFGEWKFEKVSYLQNAGYVGNNFYPVYDVGSVHALQLNIKNEQNAQDTSVWIGSGSFLYPPVAHKINDEYSVVLTRPEPKEFSSKILVYTNDKQVHDTVVYVNKPAKFKGWKIYQSGYDEKMGRHSTLSVFELVKDPWLPYVYSGIFLLIAGSVYLIFFRKK